MTINVKEMTTYNISDDGETVTLSLEDEAGTATSLKFRIPDLGNLAITLPSLIEAALRRQLRDASFRYAFPMGAWSIEQATDPASLIVTLRTKDGFGVSFSMPRNNALQLAHSLSEIDVGPAAMLTH
ncbi:MAG: hypothetical protein K2Y42_18005 [Hyphomicrobium sp.]|uniref:hypothetical protein n=1 Tax=Hyphomicrobium sp. TaxID=82 RepID=UPI0025C721BD|nr:hypothetical protein [Hyphomicrobium sp.]MBX9864636.1 hypothetical protein [Hyphomicrobium sp.]